MSDNSTHDDGHDDGHTDGPAHSPSPGSNTGTRPSEHDGDDTAEGDIATDTAATPDSGGDGRGVPRDALDTDWLGFIPGEYDPYSEQVAGIEATLDALATQDNVALEGACGTGKTLIALVAALQAIRSPETLLDREGALTGAASTPPPDYDQVIAATPVKQQLAQFVDEMRQINAQLQAAGQRPAPTVALRGRTDLTAFAAMADDESPYRDPTIGGTVDYGATTDTDADADRTAVGEAAGDGAADDGGDAGADTGGSGDATSTPAVTTLRDGARALIRWDSQVPLAWDRTSIDPPAYSRAGYSWDDAPAAAADARETLPFDPQRAAAIVELLEDSARRTETTLTVAGIDSPFPYREPRVELVLPPDADLEGTTVGPGTSFDPFYVGIFAHQDETLAKGGIEFDLPFDIHDAQHCVMGREELLTHSIAAGVCPHRAMVHLAERCEVALGNYYHLFDETTRLLTQHSADLLGEETITIVDEAHNLEERVRDILSDTLTVSQLDDASTDLELVAHLLDPEGDEAAGAPEALAQATANEQAIGTVRTEMQEVRASGDGAGTTATRLRDAQQLLGALRRWLVGRAASAVAAEHGDDWTDALGRGETPDAIDVALEDPEWPSLVPDGESLAAVEHRGDDDLSDALETEVLASGQDDAGGGGDGDGDAGDAGAGGGSDGDGAPTFEAFDTSSLETLLADLASATAGAALLIDEVEGLDREPVCGSVGDLLNAWVTGSNVRYFRELELAPTGRTGGAAASESGGTSSDGAGGGPGPGPGAHGGAGGEAAQTGASAGWSDYWEPTLRLFNCIPTAELRDTFEDVGATIAMSATLSPLEEFISVAGLATESHACVPLQFPLQFPQANRRSLVVDAHKYLGKYRQTPVVREASMSDTRATYADAITEVAQSPGSVLLAMPSYREAEWAKDVLVRRGVTDECRVFCDESSSAAATTETLEAFFAADDAVLCTSLRGTVTEGVDYDGDKLHTAAVVGVPLLPPSDRQEAVTTAYDWVVDGVSGYDGANTIPAVRKARQALGRVIRGPDERGVRVLIDERYGMGGYWGVEEFLPPHTRDEFDTIDPDRLDTAIERFWQS